MATEGLVGQAPPKGTSPRPPGTLPKKRVVGRAQGRERVG